MEESVQKAFEGFELPVSDADWAKIANGLDTQTNTKKGFWLWLSNNRIIGIAIVFITLTTLGGLLWQGTDQVKSNIKVPQQDRINPQASTTTEKTVQPASGGANMNPNIEESYTPTLIGSKKPVVVEKTNGSIPVRTGTSGKTATKIADKEPVKEVIVDKNPVQNPTDPGVTVKTRLADILESFGLRIFSKHIALEMATAYPLSLLPSKVIDLPIDNPSLQYYASLSTTFDAGKVSYKSAPGVWQGFQWLNGSNPALDMRLEGGIMLGTNNTKFTIGGAIEGNPINSKSSDTIRIQIADRFLPYKDINGNILYWLAIRWKDSLVVINSNSQRAWAEIPLGIVKKFQTNDKHLRVTVGITLNPGILLGASAQMANPYTFQSGSYWKYNNGINVDTTSAVIDASQFMNKARLGSGVQLGVEKDFGPLTWGLNLQSRYYFTPVWKSGVPLQQNSIQYGINLKLGFKI